MHVKVAGFRALFSVTSRIIISFIRQWGWLCESWFKALASVTICLSGQTDWVGPECCHLPLIAEKCCIAP
eukprot:6206535-Pleurochrysis_carterae.AAC.3